jgi:cation:H+ antiporter
VAVTPELLTSLLLGAAALGVLVKSAETSVDRFLRIARHYGVPDAIVGMTVVAVGTSLPEIGSHVIASLGILSGTLDYEIASATTLGGNMGSSTTQQTLLVGLFVIGFGGFELTRQFLRSIYAPMVLALVLTLGVAVDGQISRLDGGLLLVAYLVYAYYSFSTRSRAVALPDTETTDVTRDVLVAVAALAGVVLSAYVILAAVQLLVERLRLGGSMVGVVTLGLASALPELSTVVDAVRRRAPNLALGTLVGSNVVNPLVGIGLGGLISTYAVPNAVIVWDLPFKIVVGVAFFGYLWFVNEGRLTRREGAYLVVIYFVYVSVRFLLFAGE